MDGNVGNNSALPRITLSPQSSGEQFGQPFRRMPDGSGLVAIPINPKTGKPSELVVIHVAVGGGIYASVTFYIIYC